MKVRDIGVAVGAVLALAGCKDEGPLVPQVGDLGGTWDATLYEFRDAATGTQAVDLVAMGWSFVVEIDSGQDPPTLIATLEDPAGGTTTGTGTVDVYHARLTVGVGVFSIEESGGQMTIVNPDAVYSYGSGAVTSVVTIDLTRR